MTGITFPGSSAATGVAREAPLGQMATPDPLGRSKEPLESPGEEASMNQRASLGTLIWADASSAAFPEASVALWVVV